MNKYFKFLLFFLGAWLTQVNAEVNTLTLVKADMRTSPTSAPLIHRPNYRGSIKTIEFVFWSGDLPIYNPGAHMWIVADGYLNSADPHPIRGRGITLGDTYWCHGLGFEIFGDPSEFPGACNEEMYWEPYTFYNIKLRVTPNKLKVWMRRIWPNPSIDHYQSLKRRDMEAEFDTIIGVAGDPNPSQYGFFDVKQIIEDY